MSPTASKKLQVRFWGVRGSIPCPGPSTARYGGNTSCLQVLGGGEIIVLDGGTGLRELGLKLSAEKKPLRIHLLLSHTHWDHIQGFPFFTPIYHPDNEIIVYGPRALDKSLEEALMFQMQYTYFPVRGVELAAKMQFREIEEQTWKIGDIEFASKSMNHPIRVLAYRFRRGDRAGAYTGDNEPYYDVMAEKGDPSDPAIRRRIRFIEECNRSVVEFFRGLDLLVADAQYTDEEYAQKRGWGHSSVSQVIAAAAGAGVRRLVLFHHEPTHPDAVMDKMAKQSRALARKASKRMELLVAKEGMTVDV
ncbi:MAG TPA: MBL fold metallo-hydrolase [Planctomycetota bacterium]